MCVCTSVCDAWTAPQQQWCAAPFLRVGSCCHRCPWRCVCAHHVCTHLALCPSHGDGILVGIHLPPLLRQPRTCGDRGQEGRVAGECPDSVWPWRCLTRCPAFVRRGRGCWVGGAAEHKASGKALAPGQLTCSGSGPPAAGSAGVQRRTGWTAKRPWPTPLGRPPGVPCRILRAPCTGLRAQIATRTRSWGNGRRWRGAPARCPLSLPQADTGPCWCCRPLRPHGPRPLLRRARHCSHSLRSGGGKTPNH